MGVNISSNKRPNFLVHDVRNILNFKIVLIGDSGVGKTGIFTRYVKNQFNDKNKPTQTPAVENVLRKVNKPDDLVASITLWDLPGSEDLDMRESYYRNVDAAIIVTDLTDPDSIQLAGSWKQDFINHASKTYTVTEVSSTGAMETTNEKAPFDARAIPVLLLGNKYDLIEAQIREAKLKAMLNKPLLDTLDDLSLSSDTHIPASDSTADRLHAELALDREVSQHKRRNRWRDSRPDSSEDTRPQCVKELEMIEDKYGFVGSMAVSARRPDGSVDSALQALVRHLLADVRPAKIKDTTAEETDVAPARKRRRRVKAEEEREYVILTGADEIDEVFIKCHTPLKRAEDYESYYELVMTKFKQTCLDGGYLRNPRGSLEDCIIGLSRGLREISHTARLILEDGEGFLTISYSDFGSEGEVHEDLDKCLDIFNKEYSPLCCLILSESPLLLAILSRLQAALADMSTSLAEKYGHAADRYIHICDHNTARVNVARRQVTDSVHEVENARSKIHTATIW